MMTLRGDPNDISPSERLSKMIASISQNMMDTSLETDRQVTNSVERGLKGGVRKIQECFDREIEKLKSKFY